MSIIWPVSVSEQRLPPVSGHDITPRSTSCRLVYITAYLTAIVLLAAYSAALISSLTIYRSNLPFQNLEGILKDNTYKMGVVNMSEIFHMFSVRWYCVSVQCYSVLRFKQEGRNKRFVASRDGGLDFVTLPDLMHVIECPNTNTACIGKAFLRGGNTVHRHLPSL